MRIVVGLILVMGVGVLGGCGAWKDWRYEPTGVGDVKPIYVISHGWHTGVVISGEDLGDELSFLADDLGPAAYYELGWGDKGFYQSEFITSGVTLGALFWPTDSLMHAVALPEEPSHYFPLSETVCLTLSGASHEQLRLGILESFQKDAAGETKPLREGLYGHSYFYNGVGQYCGFRTCNGWTAQMLDRAGVPVRTFMLLTSGGVMRECESAKKRQLNEM